MLQLASDWESAAQVADVGTALSGELDVAMLATLDAVARADKAWSDRQGLDGATVDALIADGWLTAWSGTPSIVTLTPLGADRLRLSIVETDPASEAAPRWRKRLPRVTNAWVEDVSPSPLPSWSDLPTSLPRFIARRFGEGEVCWPVSFDVPDAALGPLEQILMWEAIDTLTGRAERDPATGKPLMRPVTLWGRTIPRKRAGKPQKAGRSVRPSAKP